MPIAEVSTSPSYLHGIVDMGSNGIRFSITDLSPATARSLPVLFQERAGISLYDAQFSSGVKGPIPQKVIDDVLVNLERFKIVCADFGVPEENIKVLATEATRNADNSDDYRQQIKNATGWDVDLLAKEDEGRIGAFGVASSFDVVDGLVMDLGGGSTQLTWMVFEGGDVRMSPKGSVSFPYGAAALTQQLADIEAGKDSKKARSDLREKIKQQYIDAVQSLDLPDNLKQKIQSHGLTLYLSGGGFRGWGYILMSQAKKGPYPIPIINGFRAQVKDFADTAKITEIIDKDGDDVFRVSKRRASQVPAVAFLVGAITEALPFINDVRFSQGGVREGYLFSTLAAEVKSSSPLPAATFRYALDPSFAARLGDLLVSAIPDNGASLDRWHPASLTPALLRAVADTMYVQSNAPSESASLSALCLPVTGVLAASHGISHTDRALLALILCQRWAGELPPPYDDFQYRLQALLTDQEVWWANYLGTVAALLGTVYPAGRTSNSGGGGSGNGDRITVKAVWANGLGKKGNQQGIVLQIDVSKAASAIVGRELLSDQTDAIEKMGKKKNRVGGKEYGFGVPVRVDVE